jgi:hypothetical protein
MQRRVIQNWISEGWFKGRLGQCLSDEFRAHHLTDEIRERLGHNIMPVVLLLTVWLVVKAMVRLLEREYRQAAYLSTSACANGMPTQKNRWWLFF